MSKIFFLISIIILSNVISCEAAGPAKAAKLSRSRSQRKLKIPHADSPYGINQSLDRINAKDADLMPEMGIKWVRVHFFWEDIEKEPGKYNWKMADQAMKNCIRKDFGILARINSPPLHACDKPHEHIPSPKKMAAFARRMLKRYPGKIHAVEVMNEANVNKWPGVWERAAKHYVPVLKATYKAVKKYNPDILVVSAGIWQHPMYYLEDMYKEGAKGYFDVFNFHYYTEHQTNNDGGPAYFDAFRGNLSYMIAYFHDIMKRNGDGDKPIWVTEFGWSVTPEGQKHGVGEEKQAKFTEAAYEICRTSGIVTKVFPFCFHNTDGMSMIHERDTSKKHGPSARKEYRRKVFYALRDYAKKYPTWERKTTKLDMGPAAASSPLPIENSKMDKNIKGWASVKGHQTAKWDKKGHDGSGSLKLTTKGMKPAAAIQQGLPVEGGKGYEVRGFLRMKGGSANQFYPHGMIEITFTDKNGKLLNLRGPLSDNRAGDGISAQYFVSDTFGDWYEVHYPFKAPKNAVKANIILTLKPPNFRKKYKPVTGRAWFDDITVKPFQLSGRKESPK